MKSHSQGRLAAWALLCALILSPLALAPLSTSSSHAMEVAGSREALAQTPVLALDAQFTIASLIPSLADTRAIFVGEQHDRYDHHLVQLEFIRRLHSENANLAIGMEAFQQPFQAVLDDYTAGRVSEKDMLRDTQYYQRWGIDYRLYAPILRYAREHGLPVIALNVSRELTRQVAKTGIAGLPEEMKDKLPADTVPATEQYRQRLEPIFAMHQAHGDSSFDQFVEAQLLWDEGMAERAATFLAAHPEHRMVILAGNQHVAWDDTIPGRLARRLPVEPVTILNSWDAAVEPGLADYLLMPGKQSLPPAARIGVSVAEDSKGVTIQSCEDCGGWGSGGIRKGDRIDTIDDQPVTDLADIKLALWDRLPGETVRIAVTRSGLFKKRASVHDVTLR